MGCRKSLIMESDLSSPLFICKKGVCSQWKRDTLGFTPRVAPQAQKRSPYGRDDSISIAAIVQASPSWSSVLGWRNIAGYNVEAAQSSVLCNRDHRDLMSRTFPVTKGLPTGHNRTL